MEPPSPARMGDERSASARLGPGGTVTKWDPVPSFPFKVFMNAVSFSVFTSWRKVELPFKSPAFPTCLKNNKKEQLILYSVAF